MATEISKEEQAVNRADRTGLSDTFSYENESELTSPFSEIADPTGLSDYVPPSDPRDMLTEDGT